MTDAPAWNGVPENPERDGWHWTSFGGVIQCPWQWNAKYQVWVQDLMGVMTPSQVLPGFVYLGPCLLPSKVAAREAAAALAMREAVALEHTKACERHEAAGDGFMAAYESGWAAAITKKIPLPSASALDAVRAQARREALAEAQDAAHDAVHDAIEEMGECNRVKAAVVSAIGALLTGGGDA